MQWEIKKFFNILRTSKKIEYETRHETVKHIPHTCEKESTSSKNYRNICKEESSECLEGNNKKEVCETYQKDAIIYIYNMTDVVDFKLNSKKSENTKNKVKIYCAKNSLSHF